MMLPVLHPPPNTPFDLGSGCRQVPRFDGDIFSEEGTNLVAEHHAMYLKALQDLYNKYKDQYAASRQRDMKFIG